MFAQAEVPRVGPPDRHDLRLADALRWRKEHGVLSDLRQLRGHEEVRAQTPPRSRWPQGEPWSHLNAERNVRNTSFSRSVIRFGISLSSPVAVRVV